MFSWVCQDLDRADRLPFKIKQTYCPKILTAETIFLSKRSAARQIAFLRFPVFVGLKRRFLMCYAQGSNTMFGEEN